MNIEIIINDEVVDFDGLGVEFDELDTNACAEILDAVKYELEGIAGRSFERVVVYLTPKQ